MSRRLKIELLRDGMLTFTCFIALIAALRLLNIFDPVSYDPGYFNLIAALFTWVPFGVMVRLRVGEKEEKR